jgi:hypothetical protein
MTPMRIRSLVTCAHDRPLLTLVDRDRGQWHLALWLDHVRPDDFEARG